ncbi:MAG: chitobiase/beta-hexosaminidase C-terminal domain-containing protein [Clostridia bacterium]|nr:chitobiase/beta-hexosaminidase C-terminal domain-containing protein [Clostridia bacterium]
MMLLFAALLTGCQSAQFSDAHEAKPAEIAPTPVPLPTLDPNATKEEKMAFYRSAVEQEDRIIVFSSEDGFYSKDVSLTLTAEGAADIYYTDDGSEPSYRSMGYTRAIPLAETDAELPRCMVIRAVAYYADGTKSPVFTHTYFLNTKIGKRFSVPVFSMSNSFGLKSGKNTADNDTLGDVLDPESPRYALLFAKLMEIQGYRTYFVGKVTGLLKEALSKDAMLSALKELHNARNSDMQRYFTRIEALRKTRNSGVWMKKNDFNTAYSALTNYVKARPDAVTRQLEQHFPEEAK